MFHRNRSTAAVSTAWNANANGSGLGLAISTAGVLVICLLSAMVLISAEASMPESARLSSYEAISAVETGYAPATIDIQQVLRTVDTGRLLIDDVDAY